MQRWMPVLVVAIGCLSIACSDDDSGGSSTAGCTVEACDTSIRTCHMAPLGLSPRCAVAPGYTYEASLEVCSDACRVAGLGETLGCLGENAALCEQQDECASSGDPACADAARRQLSEACFGEPELREATCLTACENAHEECEVGCPTDAFDACTACALDCLQVYVDCKDRCPRG